MLFVSVCAIGWGSEAVIINAALKEDVSSEVALALRQMTSSITYGLVVLPFIGYSSLFELLPQGSLILIIAVAGVLGTLSYLNYYKAIDMIGATQAMGLNISYPAWAFLIQYLIDRQFNLYLFSLAVIVMVGSIMSNEKPFELLNIFSPSKSSDLTS